MERSFGADWRNAGHIIEGGSGDDLLRGRCGDDVIYGGDGDDRILGRSGADLLFGGEGADRFVFRDRDAGDLLDGARQDVIGDFDRYDIIDLRQTQVSFFSGYDDPNPSEGGYSIWTLRDSVFVTWNTHGAFHDVEIKGFTGDPYSLFGQITWYDDDYAGSIATTGRIADGGTVHGAIEVPEDQDWFKVHLEAGSFYTFDLENMFAEDDFAESYIQLWTGDGDFVADAIGDDTASLGFYAETAATYYVAAGFFGVTGEYDLSVESRVIHDDYGQSPETSGAIADGETVAGEIQWPEDQDWLHVTLEAGRLYTIEQSGEGGPDVLDSPYVALLDADGNYVAVAYAELQPARLEFVAEEGGDFYISAGSFYDTGAYTVSVASTEYADDFADDTTTEGVIAPGQSIAGRLGVPGDRDWFRIDLTAGETYVFDLRGQDSGAGTIPDPVLALFDMSGAFITDNDDFGSLDSRIVFTALTSETYFLAAQEYGDRTGTYELSAALDEALPAGVADEGALMLI